MLNTRYLSVNIFWIWGCRPHTALLHSLAFAPFNLHIYSVAEPGIPGLTELFTCPFQFTHLQHCWAWYSRSYWVIHLPLSIYTSTVLLSLVFQVLLSYSLARFNLHIYSAAEPGIPGLTELFTWPCSIGWLCQANRLSVSQTQIFNFYHQQCGIIILINTYSDQCVLSMELGYNSWTV